MTNARKHELAIFFKTMEGKRVSVGITPGHKVEGTITGVNDKQGILAVKCANVDDGLIAMIPFEHVVYVTL